jgi:hypothetical protein
LQATQIDLLEPEKITPYPPKLTFIFKELQKVAGDLSKKRSGGGSEAAVARHWPNSDHMGIPTDANATEEQC